MTTQLSIRFFVITWVVMLFSCVNAFAQNTELDPMRGDVNKDGLVDVADVAAVIQIMKNGNGMVTVNRELPIGSYIDSTYLYKNGQPMGRSALFKCTDFVEVVPNSTIKLSNFSSADYTLVHFYNVDKDWIGRIETEDQERVQSSCIFSMPINAKYIRYSIRATQAATNKVEYLQIAPESLTETLVNGWYNAAHNKIANLFQKSTNRPIITVIDDDTPDVAGVTRVKELCDKNDIKCTFACLTRQIDLHPDLGEALKDFELDGFQTVIHGYSQNSIYRDYENNKSDCERDFVKGLQKLSSMGFLDFKYWVTPYGVHSAGIQQLAKKYGMKCLCTVIPGYETTKAENGRYVIKRTGLNKLDADGSTSLETLMSYIDDCAAENGWIIIMTHIANGWAGDDYSRFDEVVQYAKE